MGALLMVGGTLVIAAGFAIDRSRDYDLPWGFVCATLGIAFAMYGAGFSTLAAS